MDKFFLVQVKETKNNNGEWVIEKGVAVKDTLDDAKQGFHAYMSAYAYGHDKDKDGNIKTDYVLSQVIDSNGTGWIGEVWELSAAPQPEPESE